MRPWVITMQSGQTCLTAIRKVDLSGESWFTSPKGVAQFVRVEQHAKIEGSIGLGEGSLTFCRTIRELVESDKKGS